MKLRSIFRLCQSGRAFTFVNELFYILAAIFLCAILAGQPAFAAGRQSVTHKVNFNDAKIDPVRVLDWRSPVATLDFDVPENDWVEDIELLISARPQGRVHSKEPLLIRFNDAGPIPLKTGGHGFDARVTLDRRRMRGQRNQITIEYAAPADAACLGPSSGAWDLDIKDSSVIVKSRTKLQAYNFHDVRALLTSDATRPKSVGILAKGASKTKLEVLAAQGISKNIGDIPQFRLGTTSADMVIIAAPRKQLGRLASDPHIRKASGAQIAVTNTRPVRIVLTGDTQAQVMDAAKAFSGTVIPDSRLRTLTPARFLSSPSYMTGPKRVSGTALLSSLGASGFDPGWAPRPQEITFDVKDPAASYGRLNLRLQTGPHMDRASRVDVSLNGQALKSIPLSKKTIRAAIDIPKGSLQGLGNTLTLTPHLTPAAAQPVCSVTRMGPGLVLSAKSSLTLRHDALSDAADLSAFAATGAPFSNQKGAATTVILSTRSKQERASALRLMSQLSRASHKGWAEASIVDAASAPWPETGHVLLIGSRINLRAPEFSNAPRSLKVAMSGMRYNDPVVTKSAALRSSNSLVMKAQKSLSGGVAALYRDGKSRVVGVVTHTKGQSFNRAVDDLLETGHWNELEGSVARWNRRKVAMTQTALAPKIITKKTPAFFRDLKLPDMSGVQMSMADSWNDLMSKIKNTWERPEAAALLPKAETLKGHKRVALQRPRVPTPRLKPTLKTSAMIGQRRVAVPKAPREDIFPKIDAWVDDMGQKVGTGFGGLTDRVSGAVDATPIGAHPAQASAKPKLLVFALGTILILILAVFINPANRDPDAGS